MIHRAILGSFERFIGTITEHFAGKFPTWLAPQQVRILPITDRHNEYGNKLKSELEECGVRVHLDDRNEKVGYKIREAQADKVPYMLIIGDQEQESGTVSLRLRDHTANETLEFNDFKDKLVEEIKNKTMDSSFL